MNEFKSISRKLNKEFQPQLLANNAKIECGAVGSFLYVRITDPDSMLPAALANRIVNGIGLIFQAHGWVDSFRPLNGMVYSDNALVANWQQAVGR